MNRPYRAGLITEVTIQARHGSSGHADLAHLQYRPCRAQASPGGTTHLAMSDANRVVLPVRKECMHVAS